MGTHNFEALRSAVVGASLSDRWAQAVEEWQVVSLVEDPTVTGTCVCGKNPLVYLYTISNRLTGLSLFPIGSSCVNLFQVEELDASANVLHQLLKLRSAYVNNVSVELSSEYFSRALLADLWENDAFPANDFNRGNGDNDYKFLLDLLNQRHDFTPGERKKVWVLLNRTIKVFVMNDERLG